MNLPIFESDESVYSWIVSDEKSIFFRWIKLNACIVDTDERRKMNLFQDKINDEFLMMTKMKL